MTGMQIAPERPNILNRFPANGEQSIAEEQAALFGGAPGIHIYHEKPLRLSEIQ
jgi:hypothetical protein